MFGISGEHLIILFIILMVFGRRRLPEIGHSVGKAVRNFKDSLAGVEEAEFRKIETPPTKSNDTDKNGLQSKVRGETES